MILCRDLEMPRHLEKLLAIHDGSRDSAWGARLAVPQFAGGYFRVIVAVDFWRVLDDLRAYWMDGRLSFTMSAFGNRVMLYERVLHIERGTRRLWFLFLIDSWKEVSTKLGAI